MNKDEFEARVLELWTKTRIPLTRANLLAATKLPRPKLDRWIDEMVSERLCELDSDDDGELLWTVRGASRPTWGPGTVAELERKGRLVAEVDRLTTGAELALRAAGLKQPAARGEKKSLLASGALSFFFGPIGWIYAAPLKEAVPAIIVYVLLCSILPSFLLVYLLGILLPASAIAGVLYAWSYNHEGHRTPLLLGGKIARVLPPGRRR